MSDTDQTACPVPPDAVRVWRGYRLEGLGTRAFFGDLASVFVPATVQLQGPLGLTAYLPSLLPRGKPDRVPDEIALVFYRDQPTYKDAKRSLGGRVYSKLHDAVFSLDASRSGFPRLLGRTLAVNVPYHLFTNDADWQLGVTRVFVGVCTSQRPWREQHADLFAWLTRQQKRDHPPEGAVVAASEDYVVYWEHWTDKQSAERSEMHQLTDIFDPVMVNEAEPLLAPFGVWEQGAGVRLSSATTYNLGFDREAFRVAGEAANSQSVKKPKTTQQDAKQNQDEEQETTMSQGPWTRIRPLQIDEVDDYVASAFKQGELTWGHFPNNLMKVMGHCPSLAITEVPYANAFIFDTDVFNNGRQYAGFLDRPIKELCISRTSLYNRSRYSVTHHTFIGYVLFGNIGRQEAGHQKYLHLHEHSEYGYLYTERETACLDFAEKISRDAHEVTDQDFEKLRRLLDQYNRGLAPKDEMFDFDWRFIAKWKDYSDEQHKALVDSQLVELAWLISHFCLLNRWFTVLQVPDETAQDEADFLGAYEQGVPEDLRRRNEELLDGDF